MNDDTSTRQRSFERSSGFEIHFSAKPANSTSSAKQKLSRESVSLQRQRLMIENTRTLISVMSFFFRQIHRQTILKKRAGPKSAQRKPRYLLIRASGTLQFLIIPKLAHTTIKASSTERTTNENFAIFRKSMARAENAKAKIMIRELPAGPETVLAITSTAGNI